MSIVQPSPTDTLLADNHALMHQVYAIDSAAPVESIVVGPTGNIGIGTTSPSQILHINNSSGVQVSLQNSFGTATIVHNTSGVLSLGTNSQKVIWVTDAGGGMVGIGTATPGYLLTVNGTMSATTVLATSLTATSITAGGGGITLGGVTNTAWPGNTSQWVTSGSNIYYSAGKVGIGVTPTSGNLEVSPDGTAAVGINPLQIDATDGTNTTVGSTSSRASLQLYNASNAANSKVQINMYGGIYDTGGVITSQINSNNPTMFLGTLDANVGYITHIQYGTGVAGATSTVLFPNASVRVGIGTTNPRSLLEVVGTIVNNGSSNLAQLMVSDGGNQRLLLGYNTTADNGFIQSAHANLAATSLLIQPNGGNTIIGSTTGALIPPSMTTTQKNAISPVVDGMVVYDITLHKLSVYSTGTSTWQIVTSA